MVGSPRRTCRAAAAALWAGPAIAQAPLVDLSLEELGNVTITTAAKREQRLGDAPASVFVITSDDLRRTGVTRLPEALRLAPNLQVAEVYNGGYAISARGFNANGANKLLVLIDGRSIYTPLFAGVFWDVQDVVLEDVERIEVSSGPGSTLWGVNAVNGIINIVTKNAAATRGTLASVAAGERERAEVLRHGWSLGRHGAMRVYAKHTTQDRNETAAGNRVEDAGHLLRAGFRADWDSSGERVTLRGNAYRGNHGQPRPGSIGITGVNFALDTIRLSGANLQARWERPVGPGELSVQAYLDRSVRVNPPTFDERLSIGDLELQYTFEPRPGHTLVLGANHRRARDEVGHDTPQFAFLPARLEQAWTSLFAQDEVALGASLRLTLGARVERNDYTGNEFLPTLRLAWKAAPDHLLWAAAARTVRAPSRLDRDAYIPAQPPFLLDGGPDFRSETANVLQLGYRGKPLPSLSLSATAFHGDYDHLRTQELAPSRTSVHFGNGMRGRVSGLEGWGMLQIAPWLRLHGGFTLLRPRLSLRPGSTDTGNSVAATEGAMPRQTWQLRAAFSLPRDGELDLTLRHVGSLSRPVVPAYTAVDLRLGYPLSPGIDIALAGRNLSGSHGEFTTVQTRAEFGRDVQLQLRMRWP